MALALGRALSPLRLLGVPVKELVLSVLLALRFMATVSERGGGGVEEGSGGAWRRTAGCGRGGTITPLPPLLYSSTNMHPPRSQVFEEARNLCLGLASRGVDWEMQASARAAIALASWACVQRRGVRRMS